MTPITRRSFLSAAALASAHAAFATPYTTDPRHRLAVATYPFRGMIDAPRNTDRRAGTPIVDLAGFARFIRSEFNLFGIEPLHSHFPSTDLAAIRTLKSALDAAGVRTVNIPVDEDVDLTSPDPARREASNRTLEQWIDIAVLLQSPSIRIGAVPHGTGPADIAGPVAALQPLLRYAAARNITLLFENDDPVFGTAARITSLLQAAHSPTLRALPDFANALMGGDETFNTAAVRSMFRFAANVAHVKDAEVINKVRRTVSLETLFTVAKQEHFRGVYSLESDSDADPTADTHHLINRCLALM